MQVNDMKENYPVVPLNCLPFPAALIRNGLIKASNPLFERFFRDAGNEFKPDMPLKALFPGPLPGVLSDLLINPEKFSSPLEFTLNPAQVNCFEYVFRFQRVDESRDVICIIQSGTRESILACLPLVTILASSVSPMQLEYISPMIHAWTGYAPSAFLADPLLLTHLVHPEDKDRFMNALDEMAGDTGSNEIVYRLSHIEGGYRWILQRREKNIRSVSGDNGALFVLRDITREKEMELDLVEARERYRLFFDKAPLGIACMDRHGVVLDCNDWLCRFLAIPREKLLGLSVLAPSMPFMREYSRRILRGEEVHYEGIYTSVISGKTVSMEVDGFPLFDDTGMVIGGFSIFQDISDRMKFEKTLRQERDFNKAVIDAAATMVLILDSRGNILQANHTTEVITGFRESELAGRQVCECLIPQSSRGKFLKAFELAVNSMQDSPVEAVCSTVQGEERLVEWSFTAINIPDYPLRVIATGVDRTEQRRLEDQFREAQKMDAIGRLAGGVAHEFNNQLTAIQGYCQMLLLSANPEDPSYNHLKNIEKAVKRSADTANRLLAYSRRQTLQFKKVEIRQVVKESVELFGKLLEENIDVQLKLTDEPCIASMDPNQLQQIMLNLALNARDAMPEGGTITVEVFLEKCPCQVSKAEASGRCVFIRVSDTGYGMPVEVQEKAFEPFFTTKPVGKGTGLGLAMVYGTVKQSMGHVTIESEVDVGTAVTIALPARSKEGGKKTDKPAKLVKGHATVLMVEDEKNVNETVTAFLQKLGYKVYPFFSGEDALSFFKENKQVQPDLLLTDVILGGMNGKELSESIQELFPDIRVIFMSGYASDKLMDKGVVPSDLTLLYKPFSIFELGEVLGNVLGKDAGGAENGFTP